MTLNKYNNMKLYKPGKYIQDQITIGEVKFKNNKCYFKGTSFSTGLMWYCLSLVNKFLHQIFGQIS